MAKKKTAKRKTAKKAAPARKITAIRNAYTKTQILNTIAENTDLKRKDVANVLEELGYIMEGHLKSRGAGEFKLPGLLKVKVKNIPARKAKKNVPNPFKPGELMDIKARPARKTVKVLPLKALKEMASK